MTLKRLALLMFLATICAVSASAQVGIYGKFDFDRYTDTNSQAAKSLLGAGVGLYYNFAHLGPLALGGDVRGDLVSGDQYKYRSILIGIRLAAKVPIVHIRPYVEPVIGLGGASYTGPLAAGISSDPYNNKLTYGLIGGIDTTILPHLDWRVLEAGYTREDNGTLPNPAILLSSGLVLRL